MEKFLENIWSQSKAFEKFEVSRHDFEMIKGFVLKDLKLPDSFSLNDRTEGIRYFEKAVLKTAPFLFFKKKFSIEIPKNKYGQPNKYSTVTLNEKPYCILVIHFGENIKIDLSNFKHDITLFIRRDKNVFYYCGVIKITPILKELGYIDLTSNRLIDFIDFSNQF